MQDLRGGKGLFWGDAEFLVYHAFAGYSDQDGPAQIPEGFQFPEQVIILLQGLGEAESRVEDPVPDACLFRLPGEVLEIRQDGGRDGGEAVCLRIIGQVPRLCMAT